MKERLSSYVDSLRVNGVLTYASYSFVKNSMSRDSNEGLLLSYLPRLFHTDRLYICSEDNSRITGAEEYQLKGLSPRLISGYMRESILLNDFSIAYMGERFGVPALCIVRYTIQRFGAGFKLGAIVTIKVFDTKIKTDKLLVKEFNNRGFETMLASSGFTKGDAAEAFIKGITLCEEPTIKPQVVSASRRKERLGLLRTKYDATKHQFTRVEVDEAEDETLSKLADRYMERLAQRTKEA